MLLGLNSLIVIVLRDADRAKMLDFLTSNRALLGDLLKIAPHTNHMGDMHPVETLDAILRYFDKYSVVPTESQLRDYSATIPHANETLGMSQKVRDQLDELLDFPPSMTDLNVLPSDALSEARNHWLQ